MAFIFYHKTEKERKRGLTPFIAIEAEETKQTTAESQLKNSTQQRTISPEQLQLLVMQQLNHVNSKKDELTIAIKQLGDLATQLSNICAQQNKIIKKLKN